ncbi:hypothetical protein HG15A2_24620 [Adhaeretor mobilis]|uniref:Uncharacterized protein n=1 Tax=Adhaeretor mobilis TaxID=1930276 RepID=A0A517MWB1_9BACT|nr:hypothetical protein HG15A2_24620 [Adhaeretor mobilis]
MNSTHGDLLAFCKLESFAAILRHKFFLVQHRMASYGTFVADPVMSNYDVEFCSDSNSKPFSSFDR